MTKEQKRAYQREWYRKNRVKALAGMKASRLRNPETHRRYNMERYRKHKTSMQAKAKQRRLETRNYVYGLKSKPCTDCGVTYPPYVMDFDHVRGVKLIEIACITNLRDTTKLHAEIEKCDLVCANCHRERTHARGYKTSITQKAASMHEIEQEKAA